MKIILLQDIPKVGKRWQVKEVSAGFARNYLIPKKLAKAATAGEVEKLERLLAEQAREAEAELRDAQALAERIDGTEISVPAKVSPKGELYAAVTPQKIAAALAEQGFKIAKQNVSIPEPIKKVGEYRVAIRFAHDIEAGIKVFIVKANEASAA